MPERSYIQILSGYVLAYDIYIYIHDHTINLLLLEIETTALLDGTCLCTYGIFCQRVHAHELFDGNGMNHDED